MEPPVLNVPENYYYSSLSLSNPNATDWEIWDKNIPNSEYNSGMFPHRPVARIDSKPPCVWYWEARGGAGEPVMCESLDAAVKHFETMVGLGMVGYGYTKGMLDTNN